MDHDDNKIQGTGPAIRGGQFRDKDPNSTYGVGSSDVAETDSTYRYNTPLVDRLAKYAAQSNDQVIHLNRAIKILREHPEYEDIFWLLDHRSILHI
jgi:hypothetical protein